MAHSIQVVARHDVPITSPTFGPSGDLFAISQNGDIYRYFGNGDEFNVECWANSSGQPLGLLFDSQNNAFVCDAAHQAIFRITRIQGGGSEEAGGARQVRRF